MIFDIDDKRLEDSKPNLSSAYPPPPLSLSLSHSQFDSQIIYLASIPPSILAHGQPWPKEWKTPDLYIEK